MNNKKKKYTKPKISSKQIQLDYFFSYRNDSLFGDVDVMQVLAQKKSDSRLKQNIQMYEPSDILNKLQQMNVVSFQWNKKASKYNLTHKEKNIGFIAQEVESIFPELVSKDQNDIREIDFGRFLSLVVIAVQNLNTENIKIKQRLEKLESQISKMAS